RRRGSRIRRGIAFAIDAYGIEHVADRAGGNEPAERDDEREAEKAVVVRHVVPSATRNPEYHVTVLPDRSASMPGPLPAGQGYHPLFQASCSRFVSSCRRCAVLRRRRTVATRQPFRATRPRSMCPDPAPR